MLVSCSTVDEYLRRGLPGCDAVFRGPVELHSELVIDTVGLRRDPARDFGAPVIGVAPELALRPAGTKVQLR